MPLEISNRKKPGHPNGLLLFAPDCYGAKFYVESFALTSNGASLMGASGLPICTTFEDLGLSGWLYHCWFIISSSTP